MTSKREAVEAVEGRCPRCGAARGPDQEYCVECGLRLPPVTGALSSFRRGWLRGVGWYPGDWIWVSLLTLLVAIAGAGVAIALGSGSGSSTGTTIVTPVPRTTVTTVATLPAAPEPTTSAPARTTPSPAKPKNGRTAWPPGRNGWTIVLFSYPTAGGTAAPTATADRAAHAGLPEVGILDSGQFSSLHPGYYVVFSGVYSTPDEAAAALRSVQAAGFSSAYTRQISR